MGIMGSTEHREAPDDAFASMRPRASYTSPHPLFDPVWYGHVSGIVSQEDATLEHYLSLGWRRLWSPHPLFSVEYYLRNQPDVRDAYIDPLTHFISLGWKEGANPHPSFDVAYYLSQVGRLTGQDPLTHYVMIGHKRGARPTANSRELASWAGFDTGCVSSATLPVVRHIQAQMVEDQTSSFGLRRLFHELWHSRGTFAVQDSEIPRPDPDEFDEDAYLASYPDLQHAVEHGAIESGLQHWLDMGFYEELRGARDGSWRRPLSLPILKTMIAAVIYLRRTDPTAAEAGRLPQTLVPYAKRWQKMSRCAQALEYEPLISILMPVYNIDLKWLNLAIESVFWQTYQNWELCIVDDCSPDPEIATYLEQWSRLDNRIKVKFRTTNGHISAASNDALAMATGEYVALLDHDDELVVDALTQVVVRLNEDKKIDFLYSDEDKVDASGNVTGRFFKPAWSPEFLLSCGYTTHLSVYRRGLVEAVDGFRSKYDGAQDYDLVLRITDKTSSIAHIPEVLYHWRTIPTSTATGNEAKNYALPRAKAALEDHMRRIGYPGKATDGKLSGYTHPVFNIKGDPLVSLLIPTAGKTAKIGDRTIHLLENFVGSIIERSTWKRLQIIVMENGNLAERTLDKLTRWKAELVRYSEEKFNIARKVNLGAAHVRDEYMIILNDDMEVITPDWIEQMLQFQQQKGVGMVGPKLLFADRSIQHVGVTVNAGDPGHPYYRAPEDTIGHGGICTAVHNAVAVTGACSMTRKSLFDQVGGYDDAFDSNYNDIDFCLKLIDIGQRIVVNPRAVLWHYESMSKETEPTGQVRPEELALFHSRWKDRYMRELYMRCV